MTRLKKKFIFSIAALALVPLTVKAEDVLHVLPPSTTNRDYPGTSELEKLWPERCLVMTFAKGKSTLSLANQAVLQNLINRIGINNIDSIEIAAWADKPFLITTNGLKKPDQELADRRIASIRSFLEEKTVGSAKAYNMAESTNWLARLFKIQDAELTSNFSKEAGAEMSRQDFNFIHTEGGPRKAIVVMQVKANP